MNNALVFLFFLISQTTFSQLIKVNDSSHKESSYGPEETYYESCQSIVSQIDTATPAPKDTGVIKVCLGEEIILTGSGVFSDTADGATYEWDLGDGTTQNGQTATFSYSTPGVYKVNLNITDTNTSVYPDGCTNSNLLNQIIQVGTTPDFTGTTATQETICLGDSTTLTGVVDPTPFISDCTPPVSGVTFLPDGNGAVYTTCVLVECYEPSLTLETIDQLLNICVNIEHSYLGDLEITITSPNGQEATLHDYPGGGELFLGNPIDDDTSNLPGTGLDYCFAMNGTDLLVNGLTTGGSISSGTYLPAESFNQLIGSPLNGEWCIKIVDNIELDNGYVFSWAIEFDPNLESTYLSFVPEVTSESWDGDSSIIGMTDNTITVQPPTNGEYCYNYRVFDEFGCEYSEEVCITVNPKPILAVAYLDQCDIDSDGITDFNLTEANQLLSANYENETFTYYLSAPKAKTGYIEDQIPTPVAYTNPTPVNSIVYARVENVHGCFEVSEVNLKVATTLLDPAFHLDYFICDDLLVDNDNSNGIATFDFSDATEKVLLQFPPDPNLRVSYYTTETNALAETNPISDPSNHRNNENPIVQSIYVRIESSETNACLGIGKQITLTVDSLPIKNTIADYELCGDTDQLAFDLTTKEAEILAGQTTPILVSYHESEQHAIDNVPISADLENFINKSNPQKIHVRIQFDPNNNTVLDPRECVRTDMSFNLIVKRNPIVATPDPLIICSDQVVSSVYDLTLKRDQITIGDSTITLDYFESQVDLDANNPIQNPIAYLSSVQSKTIIVLAKGLNGCTTRVDLELKTVLYANLNTAPSAIEECETDTNGFDYFNLRIREEVILNGLNSVDFQISYYEDEMDAILGNTNTIKHPENFENTIIYTQNIYVHVKPLLNDCAVVIKLTVLVNPAPEIDILDRYVICLNRESEIINSINTPFLPQTPINTQLNTTGYSFQWYMGKREEVEADPNSFIIVDATNNTLFPTAEGAYTVIATNLVSGCRISAGTEVVGSYPPESMNIKLLSELFATNNRLEVNVIGNGDYLYRVNYGPWQSENTFNALSLGTHIIDVIDFLNCDQITKTKTIIGYPKFFTPNGDGYNDTWNIVGVTDQDVGKLTIFNRYGKLIKQIRPSGAGWDGTYNGAQLPSSDYWFTLEYTDPTTGNPEMLRAHFSLKR